MSRWIGFFIMALIFSFVGYKWGAPVFARIGV